MGVDQDVDEILRVNDGELPTQERLNAPEFWMACLRAAYGRGYLAGLRDDHLPLDEATRFEREQWARLPVP